VPRKKYDQKINFCKLHFILQYFKLLYRIRGRLSYPVIVITILSTLYVHEEQDCNIKVLPDFLFPKNASSYYYSIGLIRDFAHKNKTIS